jgi:phosphotriesterase-related protein
VLDDVDLAVEELLCFRRAGGRTVVDCTSTGLDRNPEGLREIARRTELHLIAGSGYYTHDTHPPEMASWPAEKIAEEIVRDCTAGIGQTGIKAGVIGEVGTSDPIHPDERKNLCAAAQAHQATRLPVFVHTYPWGTKGLEAADILVRQGANPARIVICHADVVCDLPYMRRLLNAGVWVEFDNFGKEFTLEPGDRGFAAGGFACDSDRVRSLKILLNEGHERRLLVTNDLCLKSMLHAYGGEGYDHILTHIVPLMRHEGIDEKAIERLLCHNPAELLDAA